jgi:signal transduction histidine kinase
MPISSEIISEGTILVVDDILSNVEILTGILEEKRYVVRGAGNGQTALMMVHNEPPDLILLDIRMPVMDGYEVCSRLKSDVNTRDIPVIFLSALDDLKNKVKGFSVGAVDYITKPFQEEDVWARIRTHLSLRNMQKKLEEQNLLLEKEIAERRKAEAALKEVNEKLELRIKERTSEIVRKNLELINARDEADSASRAKTEFLSNITHEFRTPLNTIMGMTSLLFDHADPGSEDHEFLQYILKSGNQLLGMVENLIDLSRIEANGIQPRNQIFELEPFLVSIAADLSYFAKSKGLKIRYETDDSVPKRIIGDPELLQILLERIGKNAIKFTETGEVGLFVQKALENESSVVLQFSTSDTGIGISPDHLKRIFQDFTQADGSKTRKYEGIGLGLTLVRRMIAHLGGRIWAESREGKGSTFHFTLLFGIPAD